MLRRALTLVATGLVLSGCAPSGPTSILLVSLDTLRADHLGCYGYFRETSPHIDRLAADSILFERAVTPMATTLPAHVSIMTGTNPGRHGIKANHGSFRVPLKTGGGLQSFAQLLAGAGYATGAVVAAGPLKARTGIDAGFQSFDEPKNPSRRAPMVVTRALEWLEGRPKGPFFLWLHFWDPHGPHKEPPGYRDLFQGDREQQIERLRALRFPDPEDPRILRLHDVYDKEIRFMDAQIGRLVEELLRLDLYDEIAIVVVGDHGEGLGQHHWHRHGRLFNEQLLVPLIVKLPSRLGRVGERRPELASTIDLMPTLVDTLELPVDGTATRQFEGRNLLDPGGPRRTSVFSERAHRKDRWEPGLKYSLTTPRWKYFHLTEGEDQLYDLESDPSETEDVISRHPEIASAMRARILATLDLYERLGPGLEATSEISEEHREELRSLGYLE